METYKKHPRTPKKVLVNLQLRSICVFRDTNVAIWWKQIARLQTKKCDIRSQQMCQMMSRKTQSATKL